MVQSINRSRPVDAVRTQIDLSQAISDVQSEITTGRRVDRPSDDPQAWLEINLIGRQQSDEAAWVSNIGRAETRAVQAEAAMSEVTNSFIRIQELLVQASNDVSNPDNRESIAVEMEGILGLIRDNLRQQDPYGGPLFADPPIPVPIGNDRTVVASPTLNALSTGIDDGTGTLFTLEEIVEQTVEAVRTGGEPERSSRYQPMDRALQHLTNKLTEQGVAKGRLESARTQFEESAISLADRRRQIEEVDVTVAITRLQSLDISLQAAQAVYARISQRSLLDYLR